MNFLRTLDLKAILKTRSYFLFGPRATGKSTLIKDTLPQAKVYDLLDSREYQRLLRSPYIIEEETNASDLVVIDEIQKLPKLLDEVHRLIANRKQTFLLTGSSARSLRRGAANLLAGRAFNASLFPLTSAEIPNFDLLTYLNTTGLPEFYSSPLAQEFLSHYVGTYLKEEIQAESLTRNLTAFTKFLEVMALHNGEEIHYANFSSDTGVPKRTLENYLSILEDTLIGFSVEPYLNTKKRKAMTKSKFFLFDVGVVNYLSNRNQIQFKSEIFGRAFEHFIALELRAYLNYNQKNLKIQYWRSTTQFEVDFIIGEKLALEVKSTDLIGEKHLKGLRALKEEGLISHYGVVSLDLNKRVTKDNIEIWPYQEFLKLLWGHKII